jgi:hypothetical protein
VDEDVIVRLADHSAQCLYELLVWIGREPDADLVTPLVQVTFAAVMRFAAACTMTPPPVAAGRFTWCART